MKRLLMIIGFCLLLTGCKTIYVDRIEYRTNSIPDGIMKDCEISVPPEAKGYMALKDKERELKLTQYIGVLHGDLKKCNTDKASIRNWNAAQKELIKKANEDAKK